jgi:fructose-bisphosphate aldolase, class II
LDFMPILSHHELHRRSALTGTAVVAFNVITLEHAEAIIAAAEDTKTPVITQLSENAVAYHGSPTPIARAMVALAEDSSADVVLHLDHITNLELAKRTADLGFSSVMWDSSTLPYADNVAATAAIVGWAHSQGIWVESELGAIGGKGGAHEPGVRTNPLEAKDFVAATGVDSLAVAVGSSHAMTVQSAELDVDLIARIASEVQVPLVLHGSTGVPEASLVHAIAKGMWKINIGTALNIAATTAVRGSLDANPALADPRRYWGPAREAMRETVARYLRLLSAPLA